MRRILFTLVASVMIAGAGPAVALAHGRHHRSHHHFRVHHRDFGHVNDMAGDAGTVAAFDSATGKLTIALNDGSGTVTGTVTPDTEIECEAANEPEHDNFFHNNDHGSGSGDNGDRGDDNNRGDDNDNDDNNMENCDTSALTPGATVHEAELRLSGQGAIWDRVELVAPAGSSSMDS